MKHTVGPHFKCNGKWGGWVIIKNISCTQNEQDMPHVTRLALICCWNIPASGQGIVPLVFLGARCLTLVPSSASRKVLYTAIRCGAMYCQREQWNVIFLLQIVGNWVKILTLDVVAHKSKMVDQKEMIFNHRRLVRKKKRTKQHKNIPLWT